MISNSNLIQIESNSREKFFFNSDKSNIIGTGNFGVVFKGHNEKNQPVAIKILKDSESKIDSTETLSQMNSKEFKAISNLKNCSNIVHCIGCGISKGMAFIIMEFCEEGSLDNKIKTGPMQQKTALSILSQISKGLMEMHSRGFMHRDLKPANILISKGVYKIGDFGLASNNTLEDSFYGTPLFMAPEVQEKKKYDKSIDIYSLGLILACMITGKYPHEMSPSDFTKHHNDVIDLMKNMTHPDPTKRYDAKKVYETSTWLVNNVFLDDSSKYAINGYLMPAYKGLTNYDIAFLIDATGSMDQWIDAMKTKIKEMVKTINSSFKNFECRVGYVVYRDFDMNDKSFEIFDFTSKVDDFQSALGKVVAQGGDDGAEDINGGLQLVLSKLKWREGGKVLVHFADNACHGPDYNNTVDYHPSPQTDVPWDKLLTSVREQGINYNFIEIMPNATRKMTSKFEGHWKKAGEKIGGNDNNCTFKVYPVNSKIDFFPQIQMSIMDTMTKDSNFKTNPMDILKDLEISLSLGSFKLS